MPNDPLDAVDDAADDPRLNEAFRRSVPGDRSRAGAVLVGVVHDHPASSFRVRHLARAFDPDALALELPPIAVPAFERAAERGANGEMSAAIAAAPDADAVGVDSFAWGFLRRLAANALEERASPATLRRTIADVGSVARHALALRTGNEDAAERGPLDHAVAASDAPDDQASDERTQVARSRSLLGALERPHADRLLDGTREETMAARIDSLRREGTVLAVVGMDHLDSVAGHLQ